MCKKLSRTCAYKSERADVRLAANSATRADNGLRNGGFFTHRLLAGTRLQDPVLERKGYRLILRPRALMNTRSSALAGAWSRANLPWPVWPFPLWQRPSAFIPNKSDRSVSLLGRQLPVPHVLYAHPGPAIQRWDGFSCPKAIWWPPGPFSEPVEGQKEKATENPVRLMAYSFPSRR